MASVKMYAQDTSMSVDESMEASPEHSNPWIEARNDMEREPPSQPLANFLADVISSQVSEYSQAPTSGATVAASQQPSPEFLVSLGIKVRDFAYENTLPAIVPVPRVPRQVQPAPRPFKRLQRDWDDSGDEPFKGASLRPPQGQTANKKPRSLEREPTEPLQEPVVQHTRALERMIVKRMYSIRTPPSRNTSLRARFSASPPTSPLTPLPSHFASQEPELVQPSSAFPFVVHVESPSVIPASKTQPVSLHPVLYTSFTLDSRSSPDCSPAPNPPQNASPAPIIGSFLELSSTAKESEADSHVRRRRNRGTPPASNRYQLRQRPIPPGAPSLSRCSHRAGNASKTLPRRSRRAL